MTLFIYVSRFSTEGLGVCAPHFPPNFTSLYRPTLLSQPHLDHKPYHTTKWRSQIPISRSKIISFSMPQNTACLPSPSIHAIALPSPPSLFPVKYLQPPFLDPTIETSLLNCHPIPNNYRNKAQTSPPHLSSQHQYKIPDSHLRIATHPSRIRPLLHKYINSISQLPASPQLPKQSTKHKPLTSHLSIASTFAASLQSPRFATKNSPSLHPPESDPPSPQKHQYSITPIITF